jgi:hypothetical protein
MAEWELTLLMMSGVSLETCWAIKRHGDNKFYYTVAYFGYFYTISDFKLCVVNDDSNVAADIVPCMYKLITQDHCRDTEG